MSEELGPQSLENPGQNQENPDIKIRQELESDGWQFVGNEVTHHTPFSVETGRFDPKEVKTREELEREFLDKYRSHGFTEIKLLHPHFDKGKILGWREDPHSLNIFMRRPEDAKDKK